jgi:uncharacterized protein YneF (UPF0154 family)
MLRSTWLAIVLALVATSTAGIALGGYLAARERHRVLIVTATS